MFSPKRLCTGPEICFYFLSVQERVVSPYDSPFHQKRCTSGNNRRGKRGTGLYVPELMLHVSRPVRWDSDHVTIMDDPTMDLFSEIVRAGALNRVHYGLDYFDGTLNRIGAYVIGSRAAQKCMIRALLEPTETLRNYELADKKFQRLALLEECKNLPWNAVYDMFCLRNNVPVGETFIPEIEKYEAEVTSKR